MRRRHSARLRLRVRGQALALAFALLASGCGGPTLPLEIGMQEADLDVAYGKQSKDRPPAPPRPPGSSIGPSTSPGFIAAPLPIQPAAAVTPSGMPPRVKPSRPVVSCPEGDLYDRSVPDAPIIVERGPTPGAYPYRRSGWLKSQTIANDPSYIDSAIWPTQELSPEITRDVRDVTVTELPNRPPTIRFKVEESEQAANGQVFRTTTRYLIDHGSGRESEDQDAGGLFIEQIVTERANAAPDGPGGTDVASDGIETFSPIPPIKLMDLPIRPQLHDPNRISRGVDPLTGAQMTVIRQTVRRERFDACGAVLDAWTVKLFLTSEYNNNGVQYQKRFRISGTLRVAPQLGGLIVEDDLMFGLDGNNEFGAVIPGRDGDHWFIQKSVAQMARIIPEDTR